MAEVPKALEARVTETVASLTSRAESLSRRFFFRIILDEPDLAEPGRPVRENFASRDAYREAVSAWRDADIGTVETLFLRRELLAARAIPGPGTLHLSPAAFLTKNGRRQRCDDLPWELLVEEQRSLLGIQLREELERDAAREVAVTIDKAFEAYGFGMHLPLPLTFCTEEGPFSRTIRSRNFADGPHVGVRHFLEHGRLFNKWTRFGEKSEPSHAQFVIRYEYEASADDFVLHIDTDLTDQDLVNVDEVRRWEFEQLLDMLKTSFDGQPFTAIRKIGSWNRLNAS